MGRVQNKVAIVTGGARGLGRATSILLAKEGAHVTIVDIEDELGIEVAKEISNAGDSAYFHHMDVCCEEDVRRVCNEVGEIYDSLYEEKRRQHCKYLICLRYRRRNR